MSESTYHCDETGIREFWSKHRDNSYVGMLLSFKPRMK